MKLNHDCVRSLLLFLEETLSMNKPLDLRTVELVGFDNDETVYAAMKLVEAGFLAGTVREYGMGDPPLVVVSQITWEGHKFLDTIRDNNVWGKTKKVLSKVSSASLSFTATVASQILSSVISQYLTTNP